MKRGFSVIPQLQLMKRCGHVSKGVFGILMHSLLGIVMSSMCVGAQLVEGAEAKAYYGLAVNYRPLEALIDRLLVKETLTGNEVRWPCPGLPWLPWGASGLRPCICACKGWTSLRAPRPFLRRICHAVRPSCA